MVQLGAHRMKIGIVITIMNDVRLAIIIPPDVWPMNQVITNSFQVGLPATLVAVSVYLLFLSFVVEIKLRGSLGQHACLLVVFSAILFACAKRRS